MSGSRYSPSAAWTAPAVSRAARSRADGRGTAGVSGESVAPQGAPWGGASGAGCVNALLRALGPCPSPAVPGRWKMAPGVPIVDRTPPLRQPRCTVARVEIYTSAMCGYCVAAKNLLKQKGFDYEEIRVDLDPAQREAMVARARRSTVPQIFIDGEHIGGFDDLAALNRQGGLERFGGGA